MPRSDARCTSHFSTTAVDWTHVLHGIVNRPCATMVGLTKRESLQVQKCDIGHLRPLYYYYYYIIIIMIIIAIIISTTIIWLDLCGSCMDSLRPGTGTYYQFAKALKLSEGHLDCHFGSFSRETAVTRPWHGRDLAAGTWGGPGIWRVVNTRGARDLRWDTDGTPMEPVARPVGGLSRQVCLKSVKPSCSILQ